MKFLSPSAEGRILNAELAAANAQLHVATVRRQESNATVYLAKTLPKQVNDPLGFEHFKLLAENAGMDPRYTKDAFAHVTAPVRRGRGLFKPFTELDEMEEPQARTVVDTSTKLTFSHRKFFPALAPEVVPEVLRPQATDVVVMAGSFVEYVEKLETFDLPRKHGLAPAMRMAGVALDGYMRASALVAK